MSENTAEQAPQQQETPPEGSFEPITSQEQLNSILSARLARQADKIRAEFGDVEELKAKAKRADEIEEASKSELQKAQERAQALASEVEAMKLAELRSSVAAEAGIPRELAARLNGKTKSELKADAEALAALLKPAEPESPTTPAPTGVQSSATPAPPAGVIASLFQRR